LKETIVPARFSTITVFFLGLPLLALTLRPAEAQETAVKTPDQPQSRTWTDRSGRHIEAVLVEIKDGKATLKKANGTTAKVSLESLSDDDQQYVKLSVENPIVEKKVPPLAEPKTSPVKKPSAWKIFTNRKTGKVFKGKILDRKEMQGASFWLVEDENGEKAWIRTAWFIISKASDGGPGPDAESTPVGEGALAKNHRAEGDKPPQPKEVTVTGVGVDADKALQNAFSQAIEQTVGLMVDAETVVKNDQIIRDEILTYSQGCMEKYDIVKQWQEDGSHHVTILATVKRGQLAQRLRGANIALNEVGCDLVSRQIEFELKNEEQAARMFEKVIADFDMTKLTKVEVVNETVTRQGKDSRVSLHIKLSPDIDQWKTWSVAPRAILNRSKAMRPVMQVDNTAYGNNLVNNLSWSPDGKRIVFEETARRGHDNENQQHVWIVDVSESVFYPSSYVAPDLPAWTVPQFDAAPQPGTFMDTEEEAPESGAKKPSPADKNANQGSLAGNWQVSGGAKFRIVDNGKALTVSLIESDVLREFAGMLTRRNAEPNSKSFVGTLQAVFTADAPRRHSISVTATLDESGQLHLRCSDWPAGIVRGKVITRTLNETWTRQQ